MRFFTVFLMICTAAWAGETVHYFEGVRMLRPGELLDLDNGGVFRAERPFPDGVCELRGAEAIGEAEADAAFAAALHDRAGSEPWLRVKTNGRRDAWFQVVSNRAGGVLVRFVTRWRGEGAVLPAVKTPFAIGGEKGITVRWTASSRFAKYVVERGSARTGAFTPLATVIEPVHRDETAAAETRYAYRITGVTADGAAGLPVTIEATTTSRGVVSATVELRRGDRLDFLLGTSGLDGDIEFVHTYGGRSGASFRDAHGQWVYGVDGASYQIAPNAIFFVRLAGGGIARCRLELPGGDGPEAVLHYEASGDMAALVSPARIAAKAVESGGVRVEVAVDAPYKIEQLTVEDRLNPGNGSRRLEVKDGVAHDDAARKGQVLRYTATVVDSWGRRALRAHTEISLLGKDPIAGTFQFHYMQGYSFALGRVVPEAEADVYFRSCAGGISSISLQGARGICNLRRVLPRGDFRGVAPERLFGHVTAVDPAIKLGNRANGDSRAGPTDVFIVRTRQGGWAKLAITHRGSEGGWQEYLATVRFVYNPSEPVFAAPGGQKREMIEGVEFEGFDELREIIAIPKRWAAGFQRMWADPILRGAAQTATVEKAVGGGTIPHPDASQAVLLSRAVHRDYEKATFSFGFGRREETEGRIRNDWDLLFSNGETPERFTVNTVTDDRSTITDLGKATWDEIAARPSLAESPTVTAVARLGHVYLVHTKDTDTDYVSLLRVTGLAVGDRVAFAWITAQAEGPKRSPDVPEARVAALHRLLTRVERLAPKDEKLHARLKTPEWQMGLENEALGPMLRDLGRLIGVPIVVDPKIAGKTVTLLGTYSALTLLEYLAKAEGCVWEFKKDGSIRVR